ncbi:MAG: response regulator, partial [Campylobacterota bacterium]|nr:response regulator [Campylobacterota bacterium]
IKDALLKSADTVPEALEEIAGEKAHYKARVLVAEDNIINQKLIRHILEESGLTVDLANNGLEAFERRRNGNYSLIFMDIQMPVMDGIEATHEILDYEEDEEVPHIPIVALTANALKGDREKFLAEGMDEYISKPLETAELRFVLNKYLKSETVETPAIETVSTQMEEVAETMETPVETPIPEAADVHMDDTILLTDDIVLADNTEENKILIAKRGLLESRILAKIIQNLNYEFDTLDDLSKIEEVSSSGEYDILIADSDLLPEDLNEIQDKVAIISLSDPDKNQKTRDIARGESISQAVSREILETLINKYRG